jgi:hypothetical protein
MWNEAVATNFLALTPAGFLNEQSDCLRAERSGFLSRHGRDIFRHYISTWSYGLDDRRFESRQGLGIFLFTTASRTALGTTQPPIQWIRGALSLGVKWPERKADHSSPSSTEVKECVGLYLHSSNTPSWRGDQLKKHRDNFTCYLYLYISVWSAVQEVGYSGRSLKLTIHPLSDWWRTDRKYYLHHKVRNNFGG